MTPDAVRERIGKLRWMGIDTGRWVHGLITEHKLRRILELGNLHGASTAYLCAAAQDIAGFVTSIDCRPYKPSVDETLALCGLEQYARTVNEPLGAEWALLDLIRAEARFDFAFIDSEHTWRCAALHFFLVDRLLAPGGYILFDDINWSYASVLQYPERHDTEWVKRVRNMRHDFATCNQVGEVWRLLVTQHPGYDSFQQVEFGGGMGLCRKG